MSNDEDLYFTFELGDNDNINAEFELEENDSIDCLFEINAAGTVWGSISGTLSDQEDLQAALDLKADKSELESDMAAVDEAISNVQTVVENNYNTLDNKIDNVQSDLSGDISTLENSVNNRIDATNQTVAELSTTVADNNTAINNRVDGIVNSFDGDILALETAIQNEAATRANNDTLLQGGINTLRNDLTSEISNRTSADVTLQDNINNIQNTIDNYGDIISYNASDFATAAQGLLADTALQPNDNISELNNDAGYLTDADLSGYLKNTATGSNSLTIDGIASNKTNSINIGAQSTVNNNSVALGYYATASGLRSVALGLTANAFAQNSIQIGSGANSTENTLQVRSYTLLDTTTGLIPDERISSNIARSSDIPTFTDAQIAALNSGANTTNIGQIATNTGNISSLSNTVTSNYNTLDGRITSEVNTLNGAITGEATNRQNADNALQSQIDAITSASDVFDIVGTYAELQAYDISTVPVNDIIKVLVDSTHNNAATYYRCVENNNVKSWSYIGAEGAYYTKSEADNKFVEQTITVNGQPLSSNVTLTASDVGALPSSTTIGAGVLTIQKNGVDVDTFNANATSNKTINMTVPTDTNDLTNGAGFITASAIGNGTVTINQGGTQKGTFTLNQSGNVTIDLDAGGGTPTNMVTTDTAQDISGRKTFLGEKAIYFKQQATSNKLGFTLYNPSNTELAALEYRPNTISGASLLALNCPQTTGGYVGFRYWGTPAVNIVAPKVATAGNYFMATHITDGTNTVTANNQGTVNISTLLPDVSNFVTNTSLATTLANYVTNSALTTTLADYALLTDIPTVPTTDQTYDGTSANAQSGVAIQGELSTNYQSKLVSGTNIKTINNTSLLGSGNIDIQGGVFIARYNTTSFDDILAAYNGGKNVILVRGDAIYALIRISDTYIEFCRIDNHTTTARILEFVGCDNQNVWTESLMSIANRDLSNLSTTGQAVIDSKVSKSDVWYDSTSSTLYIGVAQ